MKKLSVSNLIVVKDGSTWIRSNNSQWRVTRGKLAWFKSNNGQRKVTRRRFRATSITKKVGMQ